MTVDLDRLALVVVDVQQGFEDPSWGPRNNPSCDTKIAALVDAWSSRVDATHTFDRTAPDGSTVPAALLAHVTATNLHGEFAHVVHTAELLAPRTRKEDR